jgi:hypothetical protein
MLAYIIVQGARVFQSQISGEFCLLFAIFRLPTTYLVLVLNNQNCLLSLPYLYP